MLSVIFQSCIFRSCIFSRPHSVQPHHRSNKSVFSQHDTTRICCWAPSCGAFAAGRPAPIPHAAPHSCCPLLIHTSCPRSTHQQTRRTSLLRSNDGTDRRTPERYMYPALNTVRAVSIIWNRQLLGALHWSVQLQVSTTGTARWVAEQGLCNGTVSVRPSVCAIRPLQLI